MSVPSGSPDVRQVIRDRAQLLKDLRAFFDGRGFLEVQPPCLGRDCVIDAHLDPIVVAADQLGIPSARQAKQFFLQTSPESAMKQLLAAGAPSIYSIGPVFRAGEDGRLHRVEFTMLEWYEVGGNLASAIALTGELVAQLLGFDGWDEQTYRQVFLTHVGFDPIDSDVETLRRSIASWDEHLAGSLAGDRDGLLDAIMSGLIQPKLGQPRALVVKYYPLSQAALARESEQDPQCADRFELFVAGVELANGYDELLDASTMVNRFADFNAMRVARGRSALPVETELVSAMRRGLPRCAGVALGVDRLQMIRSNYRRLWTCNPREFDAD